MSIDAWLTLAIIAALFGLLIWGKWPTWAVFALALAAILTLDLASEEDALQGFANSGVLSVVVLYVVAAGMYRTGAITLIIGRLVGLPETERAANLRIQPVTAVGSAFLNNTPIVAMLVPVIADLGRSAKLAVSKIYMAVSHASILGGAATLIGTSSNLIIAGLILAEFDVELSVFFPTLLGLPAAIVGLAFLLLVAPRLLGDVTGTSSEAARPKATYLVEVAVADAGHSRLLGKTLRQSGLAEPSGARLRRVTRRAEVLADPPGDWQLEAGDVLTYEATISATGELWATLGLVAADDRPISQDEYAHRLAEAVVAVDSPYVGRTVSDLRLPDRKLVALSRAGQAVAAPLADQVVQAGDVMVLEVEEAFLDRDHESLALVSARHGYRMQRTDRAVAATVIVTVMIALSAFGITSLLNAALLAAVAMVATGCLSFSRAFRSIDWKTYVILACALSLEPAFVDSGLADVISGMLAGLAGDSVVIALVVVFVGTVVLTNLVTNAAAAALMFPITVGIVATLGVAWEPFMVVLMLAVSYVFINPAGYQTHLLVMEPGGYRFNDFAKVGIPLTVLLGVVVIPLAVVVYGI